MPKNDPTTSKRCWRLKKLFTSTSPARPLISLITLLIAATLLFVSSAQALELKSSTQLATAGYYQLNWNNEGSAVELQEADNPDFNNSRTLYQGHDSAALISGKSDGLRYYRLRLQQDSQWGNTLAVEVKHHSLSRAVGFLLLGLLVFVATIALIVHGSRRLREAGDE